MRTDEDRGETSAQVAVLAPVLFALVFTVVHMGSLWIAAQTAQVAARRGARAASTATNGGYSYWEGAAQAIDTTLREVGGRLAAAPRVAMGPATVTVDVSVGFGAVIPFMPDRVTRSVTVPLERYVTESER